ncbi:MAG: DMT family transporter [Anaerolineales bacterium]|nr:DMT family transporter [Anaerolineales bacterium]
MPPAATLLALTTILMWSFLAYLGARVNHVPPFLVVGIALCVSGLVSALRLRDWRVPLGTFAVGVGGIFGYHFLYFSAFQHAPALEANLINYLWPLLIVLLSPLFLPSYRLRPHHLLGALMGLGGAGLILSGGRLSLDWVNLEGYLLAGGAALVWSSYSLMTKRLPPFPTAAVGAFCLASGLLALGAYALSGADFPLRALSAADWLSLFLLGAGPMGAAFFTWDAALKRGDPRVIGSLTYLTPMSSTLVLALVGGRALSWVSGLAMALIVGGALVGSLDLIWPNKRALST